jgi:hypothetical protein
MSINPRILAIVALIGIIAVIMFPLQIFGVLSAPFKANEKENMVINCLTQTIKANPQMADNLEKHPEIITALKQDNYTSVIVEKPVYITVTPTPDGITYYAGEYQNGTRLLSHPFSWYRTDVNLPNNSLKISANVYDYRIFPNFHYKDLDYSDSLNGIYAEQNPNSNDDEFLFVMVDIYADSTITNTPNVWLPKQNSYAIAISGVTYYPVTYPFQLQIKELEEHTTQQNDFFIGAYGQYKQYIKSGYNHNELFNNGTVMPDTNSGIAGVTSQSLFYIPKGSSNMIDGYILFEIPKNTDLKDITVLGNFFSFGNAQWKLINQNSENFVNPYITPTQY